MGCDPPQSSTLDSAPQTLDTSSMQHRSLKSVPVTQDAIKARWQKEEDDNAATLVKEREEMDETQAKVNAAYIEKIANMSTGRKEYAELLANAHAEDEIRQAKFKQVRKTPIL